MEVENIQGDNFQFELLSNSDQSQEASQLSYQIIEGSQKISQLKFDGGVTNQFVLDSTNYYAFLQYDFTLTIRQIYMNGQVPQDGFRSSVRLSQKFNNIKSCVDAQFSKDIIILDCNFIDNNSESNNEIVFQAFIIVNVKMKDNIILEQLDNSQVFLYQFQRDSSFELSLCQRSLYTYQHESNKRRVLMQYCQASKSQQVPKYQDSQIIYNYELFSENEMGENGGDTSFQHIKILQEFPIIDVGSIDQLNRCGAEEKLNIEVQTLAYFDNGIVILDHRQFLFYINVNYHFDHVCQQKIPIRENQSLTKEYTYINNADFQQRSNFAQSKISLILLLSEGKSIFELDVSQYTQVKYVNHMTIQEEVKYTIMTKNYIVARSDNYLRTFHKQRLGKIHSQIPLKQQQTPNDSGKNEIQAIRQFDANSFTDLIFIIRDLNYEIWSVFDTFLKFYQDELTSSQLDQAQYEDSIISQVSVRVRGAFYKKKFIDSFILHLQHYLFWNEEKLMKNGEYNRNFTETREKSFILLTDIFFGSEVAHTLIDDGKNEVSQGKEGGNTTSLTWEMQDVTGRYLYDYDPEYQLMDATVHETENTIETLRASKKFILNQLCSFSVVPTYQCQKIKISLFGDGKETDHQQDGEEVQNINVLQLKKFSFQYIISIEVFPNLKEKTQLFYYDLEHLDPDRKKKLKLIAKDSEKEVEDSFKKIYYLNPNLYIHQNENTSKNKKMQFFALLSEDSTTIYFAVLKQIHGKKQDILYLKELRRFSIVEYVIQDGEILSEEKQVIFKVRFNFFEQTQNMYLQLSDSANSLYKYHVYFSNSELDMNVAFLLKAKLSSGCTFENWSDNKFMEICPNVNRIKIYYEDPAFKVRYQRDLKLGKYSIMRMEFNQGQVWTQQNNKYTYIIAQGYSNEDQVQTNYLLAYDMDTHSINSLRLGLRLEANNLASPVYPWGQFSNGGVFICTENNKYLVRVIGKDPQIIIHANQKSRMEQEKLAIYSYSNSTRQAYFTDLFVNIDLDVRLNNNTGKWFQQKIDQWRTTMTENQFVFPLSFEKFRGPIADMILLRENQNGSLFLSGSSDETTSKEDLDNYQQFSATLNKIVEDKFFKLDDYQNSYLYGYMQDFMVFEDLHFENRDGEFNSCLPSNAIIVVLASEKLIFMNENNEILLITNNKMPNVENSQEIERYCRLIPKSDERVIFQYCPIGFSQLKNIVKYDFNDICEIKRKFDAENIRYELPESHITYYQGDLSLAKIIKLKAFPFQKEAENGPVLYDYISLSTLEQDFYEKFVTFLRYDSVQDTFSYVSLDVGYQISTLDIDISNIRGEVKGVKQNIYVVLLIEENFINFLLIDPLQIAPENEKKYIIQLDIFPQIKFASISLTPMNFESVLIMRAGQIEENLLEFYVLVQDKNKMQQFQFQMQIDQGRNWWDEEYTDEQGLYNFKGLEIYKNYNQCKSYLQRIRALQIGKKDWLVFRICKQDSIYDAHYLNVYMKSNQSAQLVQVVKMPDSLFYKHMLQRTFVLDASNGEEDGEEDECNQKIKIYLPSYENVVRAYEVNCRYYLVVNQHGYVKYTKQNEIVLRLRAQGSNNQQKAIMNINVSILNTNMATHETYDRLIAKITLFAVQCALLLLIPVRNRYLRWKRRKRKQKKLRKISQRRKKSNKKKREKQNSAKKKTKKNRKKSSNSNASGGKQLEKDAKNAAKISMQLLHHQQTRSGDNQIDLFIERPSNSPKTTPNRGRQLTSPHFHVSNNSNNNQQQKNQLFLHNTNTSSDNITPKNRKDSYSDNSERSASNSSSQNDSSSVSSFSNSSSSSLSSSDSGSFKSHSSSSQSKKINFKKQKKAKQGLDSEQDSFLQNQRNINSSVKNNDSSSGLNFSSLQKSKKKNVKKDLDYYYNNINYHSQRPKSKSQSLQFKSGKGSQSSCSSMQGEDRNFSPQIQKKQKKQKKQKLEHLNRKLLSQSRQDSDLQYISSFNSINNNSSEEDMEDDYYQDDDDDDEDDEDYENQYEEDEDDQERYESGGSSFYQNQGTYINENLLKKKFL